MRTCRKCGETKPLSEFDVRADNGVRRGVCKDCRRRAQRITRPGRVPKTRYVVGAAELLRCRKCLAMKPWTEFPRRGRESLRLQTWCKACFSAYKAERHQKNHERETRRIHRNQRARIRKNREQIDAYLLAHPCVDCGEADIRVLDFDHVRGEKRGDVSTMVNTGRSWWMIETEIAKCDIRCANCHRRVTHQRRQNPRLSEDVWVYGDPGAI